MMRVRMLWHILVIISALFIVGNLAAWLAVYQAASHQVCGPSGPPH